MAVLENPPLIEAIFELRWGEVSPGKFQYQQNEESLFAGMFSASAKKEEFVIVENIQNNLLLPMAISHRFRKEKNTWPCFQIGLGVFTVNQTKEQYSWDSFKKSIETGLDIFNNTDPTLMQLVRDTLSASLRYQDAFFPEAEDIEKFLKNNFNINFGLPRSFLENDNLNGKHHSVAFNVEVGLEKPVGVVNITISKAIINNTPGLIMETVVHSKVKNITNKESGLLEWSEQAHEIQKHSFNTIINPTAYKDCKK